jgi:hypothetical protein
MASGSPFNFLGNIPGLQAGDLISFQDDVRIGDFVRIERTSTGLVKYMAIPRGELLLARLTDEEASAVAESDPPPFPVHYVHRSDVQDENRQWQTMVHLLPVALTNDRAARSLASLRLALPRLPLCQANTVSLPPDHPLMGISFFYRDTSNMGALCRYKPGQVLLEKGFVDASRLRGRLTDRQRLLIATLEARDMDAVSKDGEGMITIMCDGRFLVLDNHYASPERRQVTLLHLPDGMPLAFFFRQVKDLGLAHLVSAARQDLQALETGPPAPVPISEAWNWADRVSYGVGSSPDGSLNVLATVQP